MFIRPVLEYHLIKNARTPKKPSKQITQTNPQTKLNRYGSLFYCLLKKGMKRIKTPPLVNPSISAARDTQSHASISPEAMASRAPCKVPTLSSESSLGLGFGGGAWFGLSSFLRKTYLSTVGVF